MQTFLIYDPELCEFVREQGSFKLTVAKSLVSKKLRDRLLQRATSASSDHYTYSFFFDYLEQDEEENIANEMRKLLLKNKE
jgi:hypothetical protein